MSAFVSCKRRLAVRTRRMRVLECLRVVHDVFAQAEVAALTAARRGVPRPVRRRRCLRTGQFASLLDGGGRTPGPEGAHPVAHDLHQVMGPLQPRGVERWPYECRRCGPAGRVLLASLCSAGALFLAAGHEPQLRLRG